MSHLSSDTQTVYTPVFYTHDRQFVREGADFYYEDSAISEAQEEIAKEVEQTGKYMYAVIERRVQPIYR